MVELKQDELREIGELLDFWYEIQMRGMWPDPMNKTIAYLLILKEKLETEMRNGS